MHTCRKAVDAPQNHICSLTLGHGKNDAELHCVIARGGRARAAFISLRVDGGGVAFLRSFPKVFGAGADSMASLFPRTLVH